MAVWRSYASVGIGKEPGVARGSSSYGISIRASTGSSNTTFFSRGFRGLPASTFLLPCGLPGLRFGAAIVMGVVTGSSAFVMGSSIIVTGVSIIDTDSSVIVGVSRIVRSAIYLLVVFRTQTPEQG